LYQFLEFRQRRFTGRPFGGQCHGLGTTSPVPLPEMGSIRMGICMTDLNADSIAFYYFTIPLRVGRIPEGTAGCISRG
jgi:hypothetical protein